MEKPRNKSSTLIPVKIATRQELKRIANKSQTYDDIIQVLIKSYKEKRGRPRKEE